MILNVEEMYLLAAFEHSTRENAICDLNKQSGLIEDPDLKAQVQRLLMKLKAMTDDEFGGIDLTDYANDE